MEPIDNVTKGANVFHQAGPFEKVEAGVLNRKQQFVAVRGNVTARGATRPEVAPVEPKPFPNAGAQAEAASRTEPRPADPTPQPVPSKPEAEPASPAPFAQPPVEAPPRQAPIAESRRSAVEAQSPGAAGESRAAAVLHAAKNVRLTTPKGARFIRVTDTKGRQSVEPIENVTQGANVFHQAGPFQKVEAGVVNAKQQFVPVRGKVAATDTATPLKAALAAPKPLSGAGAPAEGAPSSEVKPTGLALQSDQQAGPGENSSSTSADPVPAYRWPGYTPPRSQKSASEDTGRTFAKNQETVERLPQGFDDAAFQKFARVARQIARQHGLPPGDLVVHGSRAAGTLPVSYDKTHDVDIALRVDRQQFFEAARDVLAHTPPGTKLFRQRQRRIKKGLITSFDLGSAFGQSKAEAFHDVPYTVDYSVILKDSSFDNGPFIPLGKHR